MALLPLVAKYNEVDGESPRLLLGIEEPELYQHPPQARFLSESLTRLSEGGAQVLLTTHSPHFVSARKFDQIRVVRRHRGNASVTYWSIEEHRHYMAQRLGQAPIGQDAALSALDRLLQPHINEIFFAARVIVTEGIEDVAILSSYFRATGRFDLFLRSGAHFVSANGKGCIPSLISIARGLRIPIFTIFDFDMSKGERERGNDALAPYIKDLGINLPKSINGDIYETEFVTWHDNIQASIAVSQPVWFDTCRRVANDWGWSYDRMKKDPMLLEESILRLKGNIPALDACVARIESFLLR
jgi:predicted ATP-dependent endonuclease of OLD family